MSVFDQVEKNLIERGYTVKIFATGAEAAAYLDKEIDGMTVGIGGSATVRDIGLGKSPWWSALLLRFSRHCFAQGR